MTSSGTLFRFVVFAALTAIFPGVAAARDLVFSIEGMVTRVPVPLSTFGIGEKIRLMPTDPVALRLCGRLNANTHESLKFQLGFVVEGLIRRGGIQGLRDRIAAIDGASSWSSKLDLAFTDDGRSFAVLHPDASGGATAPGGGFGFRGDLSDEEMGRLRLGQETTRTGVRCYTPDQVDQIVAEALRVMRLVAQQLPSTAPPTGAGPDVTPGTKTLIR